MYSRPQGWDRTQDLPNTKQGCLLADHDVRREGAQMFSKRVLCCSPPVLVLILIYSGCKSVVITMVFNGRRISLHGDIQEQNLQIAMRPRLYLVVYFENCFWIFLTWVCFSKFYISLHYSSSSFSFHKTKHLWICFQHQTCLRTGNLISNYDSFLEALLMMGTDPVSETFYFIYNQDYEEWRKLKVVVISINSDLSSK
jgi:hypothetical protein